MSLSSVSLPGRRWRHLRGGLEGRRQPHLASRLLRLLRVQGATRGPHLLLQGREALLRKASRRDNQAQMLVL